PRVPSLSVVFRPPELIAAVPALYRCGCALRCLDRPSARRATPRAAHDLVARPAAELRLALLSVGRPPCDGWPEGLQEGRTDDQGQTWGKASAVNGQIRAGPAAAMRHWGRTTGQL